MKFTHPDLCTTSSSPEGWRYQIRERFVNDGHVCRVTALLRWRLAMAFLTSLSSPSPPTHPRRCSSSPAARAGTQESVTVGSIHVHLRDRVPQATHESGILGPRPVSSVGQGEAPAPLREGPRVVGFRRYPHPHPQRRPFQISPPSSATSGEKLGFCHLGVHLRLAGGRGRWDEIADHLLR